MLCLDSRAMAEQALSAVRNAGVSQASPALTYAVLHHVASAELAGLTLHYIFCCGLASPCPCCSHPCLQLCFAALAMMGSVLLVYRKLLAVHAGCRLCAYLQHPSVNICSTVIACMVCTLLLQLLHPLCRKLMRPLCLSCGCGQASVVPEWLQHST